MAPSVSDHDHPTREQMIWQVVCAIPEGQVASYGQIARLAGLDGLARFVGRAMSQLPPGSDVPWHRVLKSDGRIAFPPDSERHLRQRECLESENVQVRQGRVAMKNYRWTP